MENLRRIIEQTSEALRNLPSDSSSQPYYPGTPAPSGGTAYDADDEDLSRRQREAELARQAGREAEFARQAEREAAQRARQAKLEDERRRQGMGNPFRNAAGKGDRSCIPDLQRAMLDLKRAYLANYRNAAELARIDLANYEVPLTPCPPPPYAATMTQRQTMAAAASAQACGVRAAKCAIESVSAGGDCRQAVASCNAAFVGTTR